MRALSPEADDARRHLVEYVQTSLKGANILHEDLQTEASLGGTLPNPRYGYAIFRHDPTVKPSPSTGVGTIAALKAYAAFARHLSVNIAILWYATLITPPDWLGRPRGTGD